MITTVVSKDQANYPAMREIAIANALKNSERRGEAALGAASVLAAVRKDGSVSKVWTETSIFSPCTRAVFEEQLAKEIA